MSSVVTSVTYLCLDGPTNIVMIIKAWQMRISPDIGVGGHNRVQTVDLSTTSRAGWRVGSRQEENILYIALNASGLAGECGVMVSYCQSIRKHSRRSHPSDWFMDCC
jgi:hypothetical protein